EVWIVHNTLIDNAGVGIDVSNWGVGTTENVLAANAILPAANAQPVRPSSPAGTVRSNVICGSADACFGPNLTPAPGGPPVESAGQGPEPWRPADDFADTPRLGAADVGALELD